jgi:hypothetical protein
VVSTARGWVAGVVERRNSLGGSDELQGQGSCIDEYHTYGTMDGYD